MSRSSIPSLSPTNREGTDWFNAEAASHANSSTTLKSGETADAELVLRGYVLRKDLRSLKQHAIPKRLAESLLGDAANRGHADMCSHLVWIGADPNSTADGDPRTPLHRALASHEVDVLRALVEAKADVNAVDGKGRTPLLSACMLPSSLPMAVYLVEEAGSNVNHTDNDGNTAVHLAASANNQPLLNYLLSDRCADGVKSKTPAHVDLVNNNGKTPLLLMIDKEVTMPLPVVTTLIGHKANVNQTIGRPTQRGDGRRGSDAVIPLNKVGRSALHLACARGRENFARALLRAGAESDIHDMEGNTPLDLCPPATRPKYEAVLAEMDAMHRAQVDAQLAREEEIFKAAKAESDAKAAAEAKDAVDTATTTANGLQVGPSREPPSETNDDDCNGGGSGSGKGKEQSAIDGRIKMRRCCVALW